MTQAEFQALLDTPLFRSNTVRDLCESLIIFTGSLALFWVFKFWVVGRLKKAASKTAGNFDDFLIELFDKAVLPILCLGSVYFALSHLDLAKSVHKFIGLGFKAALIIQVVRLLMSVLTYSVQNSWLKTIAPGSLAAKSALGLIRVVLWVIAAIFLIDNLGFDVNSVVAGLGIGGVAVALAAQTILGDLFNYFVITFDKPFVEGDFIIVDGFMGEIERIGIKSTRIRSLDGDQLVVSNTSLTASRVRNFKRMQKRRIVFTLGVVYQTPLEKMRRIHAMVRTIIDSQENVSTDGVHFKQFADSSLLVEAVYFINSPDYNKYMDAQHAINLGILEAFQREKIEFAYPTQTVYNYGEIPELKLVKN